MAVNPKIRGQGLGNILLKELDKFCIETGVLQVTLSTANPRAGNFYEKCGFVNLAPPGSFVFRMVKYFGERIIRKVAIVGGTHGNERIGVELVRQWAADGTALKRSSFETNVLLGNPSAIKANTRYVKDDMNRQFSINDVTSWKNAKEAIVGGAPSGLDALDSIEVQLPDDEASQARKLNELLGPKGSLQECNCDFIIDLHSSVSNVGLVAMINGADRDSHAVRLSQYLLEERKEDFPNLRITNSVPGKGDATNVDSISPYGIAFEVGPIAHGTLSSNLLEKTRKLVLATLDFIEMQNNRLILAAGVSDGGSTTGIAADTACKGVIRSLGRDIVLASTPATQDLIKRVKPFPTIDCYVEVSKIKYPTDATDATDAAVVETTAPLNPTTTCIHPSLENQDWLVLPEGSPILISTDGLNTVTTFTPPEIKGHPFQPPGTVVEAPLLYPVFINEAAYQKSGVAFAIYKKVSKVVS